MGGHAAALLLGDGTIAKRVKPTQSVDVGFQCRNAPPIAAAVQKMKNGAVGDIATISAYYYAPASKEKAAGAPKDEYRLRNWLLGAHPEKAVATGGRLVLKHPGDCWDNYHVEYTYPGNVRVSFTSKQFGDYSLFDAGFRVFGSTGAAAVAYAGPVEIAGAEKWSWADSQKSAAGEFSASGAFSDNLAFADRDKERTFIDSIVNGPVHNQIAAGVETALSCMLGRMAGYRGHEITWQELLKHGETYKLGMDLRQFA